MDQEERSQKIAAIIVAARRVDEDAGELIAAALQDAAETLGTPNDLVQGRPGSWEADITLRMARAGGLGNTERIKALSVLFVEMGKAAEDGGETLSLAMSQAVDDLGGFTAFAGASQWYWDLSNLGSQFSRDWDDTPYK